MRRFRRLGDTVYEFMLAIGLIASMDAAAAADCARIERDQDRLACYDAVFRPAPTRTSAAAMAAPAVAAAPKPAAAASIPAAANPEREFGLTAEQRDSRNRTSPTEVEGIESRIVAVQEQARDRYLFKLENGQTWAQVEPTSRQRFYAGDTITIRKAAMGSFLATGPQSGEKLRVRRVD